MAGYSVEAAMAEALGHLNRIACHFRKHEQHSAANEIGKLSIMIVNVFSEAVEQIPINEFADVATSCQNTGVNHNMIQQQAVAALMNEVEKEKDSITCQTSTLQNIPSEAQLPTTGSWAQVAGSTSSHPVHPQGVGQFMTPLPLGPASLSKQSSTNDENSNTRVSGISDVALSAPMFPEIPEAKAGVLRIYGKASKEIIQYLTTRIHEGPLQDIRLETNGRTRVTFQHASQALAFLKSNQEMEQMLGYGRFGCGYRVELAEIIDWNDDHRRMNQPIRERRRLSFARKRLFADNMSPEKWKQDIRTLAGPGNIDFLWVFNSGNATAVFTSTTVARKVLEVFNRWKDGRNVYSGVSVTYSSDPCEKELVLVKDTARPNIAKNFVKRPIR
ncbi:hypothetical protein ANOM_007618 [Aspergillus nomiae NRRL 13137]|uniref:RRM domain-containing protein n=1 Tax=Aspergillus nomiae NRRL (strain ATCC 15546 / NRRL 13137 / CBS 260.88 / M93) TaxID=1509407 RepID=A0A0L1IXX7_ASPN3|nr:uncharacterized protein ANOM_007618 [Aspergillus nomiae NRRL 13137]KNG84411.1 hypothetical protein ANOM_007618 [Aspergillus nomiae NRRL 13137]